MQSASLYAEIDVVDAAAMLCHAILRNHAFVDGNKRTAYGALVMTLDGNGLQLAATDTEIADLILSAAARSDDFEPIADWIRARLLRTD